LISNLPKSPERRVGYSAGSLHSGMGGLQEQHTYPIPSKGMGGMTGHLRRAVTNFTSTWQVNALQ
jgi:hypothetical protein